MRFIIENPNNGLCYEATRGGRLVNVYAGKGGHEIDCFTSMENFDTFEHFHHYIGDYIKRLETED